MKVGKQQDCRRTGHISDYAGRHTAMSLHMMGFKRGRLPWEALANTRTAADRHIEIDSVGKHQTAGRKVWNEGSGLKVQEYTRTAGIKAQA
jgi:hypothetical protein